MNNSQSARPGETYSPGDVAQLVLLGLERQKEELGPIAVELLDLLHRLGVSESPPEKADFKPSSG